MTTVLERLLDAAFGHPRGLAGRLGGAVMARGNADQERAAVERAGLSPGDQVLVVGHGPGVGLVLAATAVGPGGHVVGFDPSPTMRELALRRCAAEVAAGQVEVRAGSAERTGRADGSMDAVISVNNIMLWDLPAGLSEVHRVLRPGGLLAVTVHRHVLASSPEDLQSTVVAAGFSDVRLDVRERRFNSPAVDLVAVKRRTEAVS